jgi:hypothetical protein
VQGRLVALDLDDQVDAGLLGDVKGFPAYPLSSANFYPVKFRLLTHRRLPI